MLLIPAYAKVNLCLSVRGRRPDGFHEIDSLAVTVDWHDLVGVRLRPAPTPTVRLRVSDGGGGDDVPGADENLAARAAHAVTQLLGAVEIDVWLDKRLPTLAGLGGGSADAGAVLRGCAAAVAAGALGEGGTVALDAAALRSMAALLGSDVPMLLAGGAQRMRGRGDLLTPVQAPPLHLAIAVAGPSDTTATYAATRDFDYDDGGGIDNVLAALAQGRLPDDDDLGSSLEGPACRAQPELDERLTALRAALPEVRWHLTGSGGAAFALADDAAAASELASAAVVNGFRARACRTVTAPA